MKIENKAGEPIRTVEEWRQRAHPKGDNHWRPYRSACECARAWLEGDAHAQLTRLLGLSLSGVQLERGVAECETRFDDIPGRPRNHDLLAIGRTDAGALVVEQHPSADPDVAIRTVRPLAERAMAGASTIREPAPIG